MGGTIGKTGVGLARGVQLLFEVRTMLDPSLIIVLNVVPTKTDDVQPEAGDSAKRGQTEINVASEIVELSRKLHKELLTLKVDFTQEDGSVSYPAIKDSQKFQTFVENSVALQDVKLGVLNETEKKAFFLNVYNTLTIHALVWSVESETSVLQVEKFWQKYAYQIDQYVFSLDDIEHGVLRCNQLHPTYKDYFFKEGDMRRQFVASDLDCRIHFALNCGAKSCPAIRIFSAQNVDTALNLAAKNFCENSVSIDVTKGVVTVSKIFQWYGSDFAPTPDAILQVILPHCTSQQKEEFDKIKNKFKLDFAEYDWAIV